MRRAAFVLSVLVIATSAQAQERPHSRLLHVLRFSAIGLAVTDIKTTAVILDQGGHECNPWLAGATVKKAIALDGSTLISAGTLEVEHPKTAAVLYIAFIATRGWATLHNAKEMHR